MPLIFIFILSIHSPCRCSLSPSASASASASCSYLGGVRCRGHRCFLGRRGRPPSSTTGRRPIFFPLIYVYEIPHLILWRAPLSPRIPAHTSSRGVFLSISPLFHGCMFICMRARVLDRYRGMRYLGTSSSSSSSRCSASSRSSRSSSKSLVTSIPTTPQLS